MRINDDFDLPARVLTGERQWVPSPQGGVERVMLDRIGGEVARATSLVRYAAGSAFSPHAHPGGEEILVLSGVFSDEHGDYPAGWYLRNPPGSSHRPHSEPGALIFVKLYQMRQGDADVVRIDSHDAMSWSEVEGRRICPLFEDAHENVFIEALEDGALLSLPPGSGIEILVLEGGLSMDGEVITAGSWVRLPRGDVAAPPTARGRTRVWLKTGQWQGSSPSFDR